MKRPRRIFFPLLLLTFVAPPLSAQDAYPDSPPYTVTTRSGDTLTGRFSGWIADTLLLLKEDGTIARLPRSDILRADESSTIQAEAKEEIDTVGELFRSSPASTLIITPTAWPMPEGHPVLGVHDFVFLSAGVGMGNLLTFGMASTYFDGFGEGDGYVASVKISPLASPKGALAAGVSFIEGYAMWEQPISLYYIVGSTRFGTINASAGMASLGDGNGASEVVFLGMELPLAEDLNLLMESIVPLGFKFAAEFGVAVRIMRRRLRIELGGMLAITEERGGSAAAVPWLSFSLIL